MRKGFVAFLAFVLLVSLLGVASAYNFRTNLAQPHKVEAWLADSGVYDHLVKAALSQAQDDSAKNGTGISVSYDNPEVKSAAKSAFNTQLVQESANKFIEGNYSWLSGKSTKPDLNIDLTGAKQSFADKVGQYVTNRLSALPVCTPEQLAKLQIPIDPVSANCRPGSLDPKTEGSRVADEVMNSGEFLNKPVVTADTISGNNRPYYEKLSSLPTAYRLVQNLVWVFGLIIIICSLGIVFIHPDRRKGIRGLGISFALAGVLLIATKLISGTIADKLEHAALTGGTKAELDVPFTKFLHSAESQLTQSNMLFGAIFGVIGLAVFAYLFITREGRVSKKSRQVNAPASPSETPTLSSPEDRPQQPPVTSGVSDRLRPPRPSGPPVVGGTPHASNRRPALSPLPRPVDQQQGGTRPRPPKPPRLIQ